MVGKIAPRDPAEEHRDSTPLELLFDLVFVVAVAFAASGLHHDIAANHLRHGLVSYALVFFAIWWAWVSFTWFASAYDTDDVPFRISAIVQMAGALVIAAGVPRAFSERDFTIVLAGYIVMRLSLVVQWLRVARDDPAHRRTALRYAIGVTLIQIAWTVAILSVESNGTLVFLILATLELIVPVWAEAAGPTSWHHGHIIERYGLFTIIVIGESVLASSLAIQTAVDLDQFDLEIASITLGGFLTLIAIWWTYFGFRDEHEPGSIPRVFAWSYGHYFIWSAIAAVGVGISLAVDKVTTDVPLGDVAIRASFTLPVAVFLAGMWIFHAEPEHRTATSRMAFPVAIVVIVSLSLLPAAQLLTAACLWLLIVVQTKLEFRHS